MTQDINDFLEHYGVKGMRWGKRKSSGGVSSRSSRVKSDDHTEAQALKKKRTFEMSNADLKKLNERMQLEQTYSQLMAKQGSSISKGRNKVKMITDIAKTAQDLHSAFNSPAAKAAREMINLSLKS